MTRPARNKAFQREYKENVAKVRREIKRNARQAEREIKENARKYAAQKRRGGQ